jgi:D-lyxose ketol-isomerase
VTITRTEHDSAQARAAELIRHAGIAVTDAEGRSIEVADFGLGHLDREGAQILTLLQTDRISVKVLVLLAHQTEPEHWHPPVGEDLGKEETVRVVSGTLHLFREGEGVLAGGVIPEGKEGVYTCRREVVLRPGDQVTLPPGEKHWFQARAEPVVMYSFSTVARDTLDRFSDPAVERVTSVVDD